MLLLLHLGLPYTCHYGAGGGVFIITMHTHKNKHKQVTRADRDVYPFVVSAINPAMTPADQSRSNQTGWEQLQHTAFFFTDLLFAVNGNSGAIVSGTAPSVREP